MEAESARQRLDEERTRLEDVRSGFDEEGLDEQTEGESLSELSSFDQHEADLGTETFEREKDLAILERVEAELADVEHAMRRLDEGSYGTCEVCGSPIHEARLEALPATRFCVEHQALAERQARAEGARSAGDQGRSSGLG